MSFEPFACAYRYQRRLDQILFWPRGQIIHRSRSIAQVGPRLLCRFITFRKGGKRKRVKCKPVVGIIIVEKCIDGLGRLKTGLCESLEVERVGRHGEKTGSR